MGTLDERIHKVLDDIIDVAFTDYEDTKRKERFHWFRLNILTKENKTTNGCYHPDTHTVDVYNASHNHLAKTALHEVAHHIDYCMHGSSGHQEPFYEIYEKLIWASLDMGILTKDDFKNLYSSDRNKVAAIIDRYKPHPVEYQKDEEVSVMRVTNCFEIRKILKEHGYKWNNMEQTWDFVTKTPDEEEEYLQNLGVFPLGTAPRTTDAEYSICQQSMQIDAVVYIKATGKSYEAREQLKAEGFYFNKENKLWVKKVSAADCKKEIRRLYDETDIPDVKFSMWSRK